jgi:hypothetical protein
MFCSQPLLPEGSILNYDVPEHIDSLFFVPLTVVINKYGSVTNIISVARCSFFIGKIISKISQDSPENHTGEIFVLVTALPLKRNSVDPMILIFPHQ